MKTSAKASWARLAFIVFLAFASESKSPPRIVAVDTLRGMSDDHRDTAGYPTNSWWGLPPPSAEQPVVEQSTEDEADDDDRSSRIGVEE